MKYVIFDLDNCLADDSARIPLINWAETHPEQRYAAYHADVGSDLVGNYLTYITATQLCTPIFLTARPHTVGKVDVRAETLRWIEDQLGMSNPILLMRNTGDHRPSVLLKQTQLENLSEWDVRLTDVLWAYDDRPDVVAMYRANGINAEVLAIHAVDACVPPSKKRAPDFLEAGAATFRERNALYGDTYLEFGRICAAMFPAGVHIEAGDQQGFNRLGVLVQAISKVARYGANLNTGGHQDSAHDLMVYAAMLEEVTK